MTKSKATVDRELSAISAILEALNGLDGESTQRVLDYVFGRLSLGSSRYVSISAPTVSATSAPSEGIVKRQPSIRDLKDDKQPESSNQMAALVAFYLSEVAPEPERKHSINASDVEKYFKQAAFKLPKSIPHTLPNAAAAGYFDSSGNGLYTLNAVGYNLVVHGLPRNHATPKKKQKKATRRQG
jgi:hypothetical protein